jgi:hypothetical protein
MFSPIFLIDEEGNSYPDGEAPSKWSYFFPALHSVRYVDPDVPVYLLTNFLPHPHDLAELHKLHITLVRADSVQTERTRSLLKRFNQVCGVRRDNFFSAFGMKRWIYMQGFMETVGIDMAFAMEGDNLLLSRIAEIFDAYSVKGFQSTVSHVSSHAAFESVRFLQVLNERTVEMLEYLGKCLNGGGAGFDMRMQAEGARALHRLDGAENAKVQNTWTFRPCELRALPWKYTVCPPTPENESESCVGPCCHEKEIQQFNEAAGYAGDIPALYECSDLRVESYDPDSLRTLNGNLKGRESYVSPLTRPDPATQNVELSRSFRCNASWINTPDQYNKRLFFSHGRVYTRVIGQESMYVHMDSLHFQGGGCKEQMEFVFAAIKRSKDEQLEFTCDSAEGHESLYDVEQCMRTGANARPMQWKRHKPNAISAPSTIHLAQQLMSQRLPPPFPVPQPIAPGNVYFGIFAAQHNHMVIETVAKNGWLSWMHGLRAAVVTHGTWSDDDQEERNQTRLDIVHVPAEEYDGMRQIAKFRKLMAHWYKYAMQHEQVHWFVKTDFDIFVNVPALLHELAQHVRPATTSYYMGACGCNTPSYDDVSFGCGYKFSCDPKRFEQNLPFACSRAGYILSRHAVIQYNHLFNEELCYMSVDEVSIAQCLWRTVQVPCRFPYLGPSAFVSKIMDESMLVRALALQTHQNPRQSLLTMHTDHQASVAEIKQQELYQLFRSSQ